MWQSANDESYLGRKGEATRRSVNGMFYFVLGISISFRRDK